MREKPRHTNYGNNKRYLRRKSFIWFVHFFFSPSNFFYIAFLLSFLPIFIIVFFCLPAKKKTVYQWVCWMRMLNVGSVHLIKTLSAVEWVAFQSMYKNTKYCYMPWVCDSMRHEPWLLSADSNKYTKRIPSQSPKIFWKTLHSKRKNSLKSRYQGHFE